MATPVRIVKVQSNESGNWSQTGSRTMNFDIHSDLGVVDLDKSYLLFKMEADTEDTTVAGAVRPVAIAGGNSSLPVYSSSALIQNSYLECERAGRLEDHNNCNNLNQALEFYGESAAEKQSQTVYNGAFSFDEYQRPRSVFRELRYLNDGGDSFTGYDLVTGVDGLSPELTPEIRVPLKKVAKMADGLNQCPLFALGDMRLHLEVEPTLKVMHTHTFGQTFQTLGIADISDGSVADRSATTLSYSFYDPRNCDLYGGMPIRISYTTADTSGSLSVTDDTADLQWFVEDREFSAATGSVTVSGTDLVVVQGDTAAIQGLTLVLNFDNSVDDQYSRTDMTVDVCVGSAGLLIGDQFTLPGTVTGADASIGFVVRDHDAITTVATNINTYITGLSHSNTNGTVVVTFNDPVPVVAGAGGQPAQAGDMTITPLAPDADPTWSITEANLVLHQLVLSPEQMETLQKNINNGVDIPYMVWDLERSNVNNATTLLTQQYRLPPNCGNVLALNYDNTNLVGETNNVSKFRFLINNTQTTDSDIEVREPLYYDRIVETWQNMGKELKNLDETYSLDTNEQSYNAGNIPAVYPQPIPLMPQDSILDFRATATGGGMGTSNMYIYKQKQRLLKLSGERAEVIN